MKQFLNPCKCGGRVGKYAAVKLHPTLNLLENVIRYKVKCARCKQTIETKQGKGFTSFDVAIKIWNKNNKN